MIIAFVFLVAFTIIIRPIFAIPDQCKPNVCSKYDIWKDLALSYDADIENCAGNFACQINVMSNAAKANVELENAIEGDKTESKRCVPEVDCAPTPAPTPFPTTLAPTQPTTSPTSAPTIPPPGFWDKGEGKFVQYGLISIVTIAIIVTLLWVGKHKSTGLLKIFSTSVFDGIFRCFVNFGQVLVGAPHPSVDPELGSRNSLEITTLHQNVKNVT